MKYLSYLKYFLLPILAIRDGLQNSHTATSRRLISVVLCIVFGFWWFMYFQNLAENTKYALFQSGIWDKPINVPVSGHSMMPTIEDGSTITLSSPQKFPPTRGDIISFQNLETGKNHYLKRIVGLPGDNLLLKNGQLWLNGQHMDEPYTLRKDATYGNTFALDCESITVPKDKFFVMGDNRTGSWDSRAIGFVSKTSIDGVIKSDAKQIHINQEPQNYQKLEPSSLLMFINKQRQQSGSRNLQPSRILQSIAQSRIQKIKDNPEQWKQGQLPVQPDLDTAGYRYNLANEYITFGYLTSDDVVEQMIENDTIHEYVLSDKFWEAGIAIEDVTQGDCTYPLISIIFSWPDSPTYDPQTISYWEEETQTLEKTLDNLQSWVGYEEKDQKILRETITTTATMAEISNRISTKMNRKEWLSSKDQADIKEFDRLLVQLNHSLTILFPKVQGTNTMRMQIPIWW